MSLNNQIPPVLSPSPHELLDIISNGAFYFNEQVILEHHTNSCDCHLPPQECIKFYQRYCLKDRIFHSLAYKKKGSCNSYLIQYWNDKSKNIKSFGEVIVFFKDKSYSYALVRQLNNKHLFSDYFKLSKFYMELRRPLDSFYYVVTREENLKCILANDIIRHCIGFEKNQSKYFIVTPISSYEEHD